ncbi:uncharacterized protein LOC126979239 [Leptidea sinapis]|uniref:Uncharacterized protein n=1 Tax=Leptidea sinapis TaxID=189913 RepID=A0A5E4PVW1_9NEOP|nr:uncharacterized protein LOC126979239 [Leptidea sinapis]VVC89068.1 unnamed protein product [Leptidea sinapis]
MRASHHKVLINIKYHARWFHQIISSKRRYFIFIITLQCVSIKIKQMLAPQKKCNKMMLRLNNFLYVFNLRQGTILIAVHQIALSSFFLIVLLVGISHLGEMLQLLHNDMKDEEERRGFYGVGYGDHVKFHESDVISTNNQLRFIKAQRLASFTVVFLYTSTILTTIYLICSISLLHGAVKYKRQYILPWIMAACIAVVLLLTVIILGDGYPCIIKLFGGHNMYHFGCALFILTFIYAICAVSSFAIETGSGHCRTTHSQTNSDERGERLLLLDHAAHSSLLSAAQLNKLSHGTLTHFV